MKKILTACLAVVLVSFGAAGLVQAQDNAAPEVSNAHKVAAEQFLLAMQTPQQLQEGISSMVELMIQSQPTMMPYQQTIRDFYARHLSWDALKDQYISITTGLLSESELNTLTEFFQTDVGKTFIEKQPEMFQKTAELGYRVMQENQDELFNLIEAQAEIFADEEAAVEDEMPEAPAVPAAE